MNITPSKTNSEIIFWQRLDQSIVAQKADLFFEIPKKSEFGHTTESRQIIADNFDTCPILSKNIKDFSGAQVIDRITPKKPVSVKEQESEFAIPSA